MENMKKLFYQTFAPDSSIDKNENKQCFSDNTLRKLNYKCRLLELLTLEFDSNQLRFELLSPGDIKNSYFSEIIVRIENPQANKLNYIFCEVRNYSQLNNNQIDFSIKTILMLFESFCKVREKFAEISVSLLRSFDDCSIFIMFTNGKKSFFELDNIKFEEIVNSHILTSLGFNNSHHLQLKSETNNIFDQFSKIPLPHCKLEVTEGDLSLKELFDLFKKKFILSVEIDRFEVTEKIIFKQKQIFKHMYSPGLNYLFHTEFMELFLDDPKWIDNKFIYKILEKHHRENQNLEYFSSPKQDDIFNSLKTNSLTPLQEILNQRLALEICKLEQEKLKLLEKNEYLKQEKHLFESTNDQIIQHERHEAQQHINVLQHQVNIATELIQHYETQTAVLIEDLNSERQEKDRIQNLLDFINADNVSEMIGLKEDIPN